MSTSDSAPTPPVGSTKKQKNSLKRWVIVISTVMVSLLLFLFVRFQGHVRGRELSPESFFIRDFEFYEIPWLQLQITPIRRSNVTAKTSIFLRQKSFISPSTPPDDSWHLVSLSRGFSGQTSADALLLTDQLLLEHQGGDFWRQWSIDHANHATVLWPIIQRLAKRELYLLIPSLLEIALADQSVDEMTERLDRSLRQQYHDLILDIRAADRKELADSLLNDALADYPDDLSLRKLRSAP